MYTQTETLIHCLTSTQLVCDLRFLSHPLQMQSLCSSEDAMALLDHMESQYYELQLQLYDIQAEILQCEELLLTAQLDSIRRQMTGMALFQQNFRY